MAPGDGGGGSLWAPEMKTKAGRGEGAVRGREGGEGGYCKS